MGESSQAARLLQQSLAGQEAARRDIRENPKGAILADEMAKMARDVKNERVYSPKEDDDLG